MSKIKIAVIGAGGFVGSAILKEAGSRKVFNCISVFRHDDMDEKIRDADFVIHSANSSKRFRASVYPEIDFEESVEKTRRIVQLVKHQKLILISSISARSQIDTVYGRHRKMCEDLVDQNNGLIIRLGPMFSANKLDGALFDMIENRPVYVSASTKYAFVPVEYNARKILDSIAKYGIIEIGAKDSISLGDLKKTLNSSSEFIGVDDTQEPINPPEDAPSSYDVVAFAQAQINLRTKK